jgi:hypothetical protein
MGVECGETVPGRFDLGPREIGGAVHDLPLQVRQLDMIVVDQDQSADAGRGQVHRDRRAEPAEPDHEHRRFE